MDVITGKELNSPDADRVFTMDNDASEDYASEEYEPECLVYEEMPWVIALKTTLLRKAQETMAGKAAEDVPGRLPPLATPADKKKVSSIFSDGAAAKILVSDLLGNAEMSHIRPFVHNKQ
jgi:hypothetical protein